MLWAAVKQIDGHQQPLSQSQILANELRRAV
jgi:hypothetical protein